jgi:hypothetical protein
VRAPKCEDYGAIAYLLVKQTRRPKVEVGDYDAKGRRARGRLDDRY